MWGTGTGSEVMQRIAAPMVGGDDYSAATVDVCISGGVSADAPSSQALEQRTTAYQGVGLFVGDTNATLVPRRQPDPSRA